MKRRFVVPLAALLLVAAGSPQALAASLHGRSSTQVLYFADERDDNHMDVAESLRFFSANFDEKNSIFLTGYGRVWGEALQGGGVEGRLYYLYMDKRGLVKNTDVRLGRQFFYLSGGSAVVDGARLDARPFPFLAVTAVGGRHVIYDIARGEATAGGDYAGGAQVTYTGVAGGSYGLSFYTTYDEHDLARQIVGFAGSQRIKELAEAYAQLRYDYLSEDWSEIQVGVRTAALANVVLNAEYFRSIPVFDASSIFSVFAAETFQEALLRGDFAISPRWTLSGEYRNERYGGGDQANVGEAGARYRPRDGYALYGAGIWRVGSGGNIYGFELSGDAAVNKICTLAAGVQHDQFRREGMAGYDPATRLWAGVLARLRKNVSVEGRLEDTISEKYDADVRWRLALNYDF